MFYFTRNHLLSFQHAKTFAKKCFATFFAIFSVKHLQNIFRGGYMYM